MNKERFEHIDFLRFVAITGVIATHVLSYNLINSFNNLIWNYLHFVVPAFVFCSGYVLTKHYKNKLTNLSSTILWYKKRALRLLIPFYIYLVVHYDLLNLFPSYFTGLGLSNSPKFIFESIILIGGIGLNWLPLLFLQLTFLFPIFMRLILNKKLLISYIIFSAAATIFFTIKTFPYSDYRYVMWIPWSLILIFSISSYIKDQTDTKVQLIRRYIIAGSISGAVFLALFALWHPLHKSFSLISYKYPPSLYYLSYSLTITCIFIVISRLQTIQKITFFKNIINFISENSYTLFFVHYIFLDFILKAFRGMYFWSNAGVEFIIVLTSSSLICIILQRFKMEIVKFTKIYGKI